MNTFIFNLELTNCTEIAIEAETQEEAQEYIEDEYCDYDIMEINSITKI